MVEIWLLIAICICMQLSLSFLALSADPPGFINIDCGIGSNTRYVNKLTGLTYVSDDEYIDTGVNCNVADDYNSDDETLTQYNTVRSFPDNARNCYTVRNVTKGSKYLVRASFRYGDYDNKGSHPSFDLYLGVIFWSTVDAYTGDSYEYYHPGSRLEIIAVALNSYIEVCLVDKGEGSPFISALEFRPLSSNLYSNAHSQQILKLLDRANMGVDTGYLIRYPEDGHDRQWYGWTHKYSWTAISTDSPVTINSFDVPSSVLQTAVVPTNASRSLDFYIYSSLINNQSATFYFGFHFADIQPIGSTDIRSFYVYINGEYKRTVTPGNFSQTYREIKQTGLFDSNNVSLRRTSGSTLPPILNAFEIFEALPVMSLPTDGGDVTAINSIKRGYNLSKDWNGDPCVPTKLRWTGVDCTNDCSVFSRITALDLSYSRLEGAIIDAFGSLSQVQNLNLAHNDLSGTIPSSLDQLTALEYLDISSNFNLHGKLPPGLMKRLKNGHLQVNYNGTGIVTVPDDGTKKSSKVVLIAIVAAVVVLLIGGTIVVLFFLCKMKQNDVGINPHTSSFGGRRFSFEELKLITNNFSVQIGVGGFGKVFKGYLENGEEVAVKVHSGLSSQGVKEFLNEVESLSRVHHKNLVTLIGYCDDKNSIALIYEYMHGGNLQNWLRGKAGPLDWKLRLQIVYDSAQGLEYLHKMCNPPLIHRDVKANNILLTTNLEAKISDFGLVRALQDTHVSTKVVGTPGYLDPFYAFSSQLTEKSDVYSFGVVLLEIITGRSPVLDGPQTGEHLTKFVHQKISRGNIESVLDPKIEGQYNLNSVWKVAGLALRCTDEPSRRPDMTEVVTELKETLDLENCSTGASNVGSASADISLSTDKYNHSRNENPSVGDVTKSDIEMVAHMKGMLAPDSGPSAR